MVLVIHNSQTQYKLTGNFKYKKHAVCNNAVKELLDVISSADGYRVKQKNEETENKGISFCTIIVAHFRS